MSGSGAWSLLSSLPTLSLWISNISPFLAGSGGDGGGDGGDGGDGGGGGGGAEL